MLSQATQVITWNISAAYSFSHPIRTLISLDNFSLPSYSFVNIIRVSFFCFLWKIHQGVSKRRKQNLKVSVPKKFHWPVKYHLSLSQNTSLAIFLCVVIKISFLSSPSLLKWKLFVRAHKQQHHINYPIYSADLWGMLRGAKTDSKENRKFINLKEAIDCWLLSPQSF